MLSYYCSLRIRELLQVCCYCFRNRYGVAKCALAKNVGFLIEVPNRMGRFVAALDYFIASRDTMWYTDRLSKYELTTATPVFLPYCMVLKIHCRRVLEVINSEFELAIGLTSHDYCRYDCSDDRESWREASRILLLMLNELRIGADDNKQLIAVKFSYSNMTGAHAVKQTVKNLIVLLHNHFKMSDSKQFRFTIALSWLI